MQIIVEYLQKQPSSSTLKIHSEGYHPMTPFRKKSNKEYTTCLLDKWQHQSYMDEIKRHGTKVEKCDKNEEYFVCHRMMHGDHSKWVTMYIVGKAILVLLRPVEDTSIVLERVCILSRNK